MPSYSSKLYKSIAVIAGIVSFFFAIEIFDSLAPLFIAGWVFLIYFWFGEVLYGLEENSKILQEISNKLGKVLLNEFVDDVVETSDEHKASEVIYPCEIDYGTQTEIVKEINNSDNEWNIKPLLIFLLVFVVLVFLLANI